MQHRLEPVRLTSPRLTTFFAVIGCSTANSECGRCCNVYRTILSTNIPLAVRVLHGGAASSVSGSVLFCAGSKCSVSLNE